ncbi:MAG: hypothetical protein M0R06_03005 [Sphaerochaeta sp.]|jgi:hypothetical protein|nr:hypothetical protein [Sphaerochaeta sp.]
MKTLGLCILFCAIGAIEDLVVAYYYANLARRRAFRTAAISGVHTLLAVFVVATIITGDSIPLLLCYAAGGFCGTYAAVRWGK